MKLSCLPVSLYQELSAGRMTLADWIGHAARLGLDGADLSVMHVSRRPADLVDLRRQADDAGIGLAILATYADFTHPDAAYRQQQRDDIRAWIDAAAALGLAFLRVTAGQARADVAVDAALEWVTEGLSTAAAHADAAGVGILFENHVRGAAWTANDFTQPASRFLEVCRRTTATSVRVLFDTANCLALDEDPHALLRQAIDRLGAVHLSDLRQRGTFEPTLLGTGAAPNEMLCRTIVESGFDGWVSVEEASRTGLGGIERAVAVADDLWVRAGGRARARAGR